MTTIKLLLTMLLAGVCLLAGAVIYHLINLSLHADCYYVEANSCPPSGVKAVWWAVVAISGFALIVSALAIIALVAIATYEKGDDGDER